MREENVFRAPELGHGRQLVRLEIDPKQAPQIEKVVVAEAGERVVLSLEAQQTRGLVLEVVVDRQRCITVSGDSGVLRRVEGAPWNFLRPGLLSTSATALQVGPPTRRQHSSYCSLEEASHPTRQQQLSLPKIG